MSLTRLFSTLFVAAQLIPGVHAGDIGLTTVDFDIKPGSFPNPINLKSQGVLPTAILSAHEFDALHIDPATILFGDPDLINNGATAAPPIRTAESDVNQDGMMDLSIFFEVPMIADYGALGPNSGHAMVTGTTFAGVGITGSDSIRIVPPRDIPEPSTAVLLVIGCVLVWCWRLHPSFGNAGV